MKITPEQRQAWAEKTASDAFNLWLNPQIRNLDGSLDLDRLYAVARRFGIDNDYKHLNPGQQRMNLGNRLRRLVPPSDYGG